MKKRDIFLSGILLVLVGVLLGLILSIAGHDSNRRDLAEVKITEITRSSDPAITQEDLENIDSRFLFQKIARDVTPAVVFIETIIPLRRSRFTEEELDTDENLWEQLRPRRISTVGSGVIISRDGYILTNNHVIDGALDDGISITLDDKRTFEAHIVGADPSTDLAILKVDASGLPAVVLGDSDYTEVGEWVLAIGNPFQLRSTVTAGIVSALSRDVQIIDDDYRIESFIQTDAAINRGNSGGALVNTSGELIGINTAIATQGGSYQGYGFAVPSNLALKIASDIIEFGEVRRGLMGVHINAMSDARARDLGMDSIRGVLVVEVPDDGAAHDSGIEPDDVILEVNGAVVNEVSQLQEKVAMYRPGDTVSVTLWRDGGRLNKDIILREVPVPEREVMEFDEEPLDLEEYFGSNDDEESSGIETYRFELGFTVRAIVDPLDASVYTLTVSSVQRGSEAWNRGLRQDSEITEVGGVEVTTLSRTREMIRSSLEEKGSVILTVVRPGSVTAYIELRKP